MNHYGAQLQKVGFVSLFHQMCFQSEAETQTVAVTVLQVKMDFSSFKRKNPIHCQIMAGPCYWNPSLCRLLWSDWEGAFERNDRDGPGEKISLDFKINLHHRSPSSCSASSACSAWRRLGCTLRGCQPPPPPPVSSIQAHFKMFPFLCRSPAPRE